MPERCNAYNSAQDLFCMRRPGHRHDHYAQGAGRTDVLWPNHQEDTVQLCGFVTSGYRPTGCRKLAGHAGPHDLSDPVLQARLRSYWVPFTQADLAAFAVPYLPPTSLEVAPKMDLWACRHEHIRVELTWTGDGGGNLLRGFCSSCNAEWDLLPRQRDDDAG